MPTVSFTSDPSTGATVRYQFWVGETSRHVLNFDPGAPTIEATIEGVEPVILNDREITFTHRIVGTRATAMALLSQVARELLRPSNWLMVQWNADREAVWFKTKASPGRLLLENAGVDIWDIEVAIPAEGLAYGAKETIAAVTINNNPAAATNPCRYLLPAIKGDAPAPLSVVITPSVSWTDMRPFMALAPLPSAAGMPALVWQTNGFTAGTDTSHVTGSAGYSGSNRSAITFATTPGMTTRLSGAAPSTPPAGRYKVLARMVRNTGTDTQFSVRLGQNFGLNDPVWGETVSMTRSTTTSTGFATLMDLGDFAFPLGGEGWSAAEVGAASTPDIQLQVQRTSGTGEVSVDYLVLIPLSVSTALDRDARSMYTLFRSSEINSSRSGIWDAEKQLFRAMNFGTSMQSAPPPEIAGGWLQVVPGMDHIFYLHHTVGAIDPVLLPTTNFNSDAVASTASVQFEYFPRWLWIGDG